MEQLSNQEWDVIICGTNLEHSLLALALSRSNKQILHVDGNNYYGQEDAAFSLLDLDQWAKDQQYNSNLSLFRNALSWRNTRSDDTTFQSQSRSYTLSLSPQIIYARSNLLTKLVSSGAYKQLEFQAVGNWWIFDESLEGSFKKLPSGREDIFQDKTISNASKRSLMKFLKFVVDYTKQPSVWESESQTGLGDFLIRKFSLPSKIHPVIAALTLTLNPIENTSVQWALPRVARHMLSMGRLGNGFAAVVPKWGGNAEISQVACRACAVGGGLYVLGVSAETIQHKDDGFIEVRLTNGSLIKTRHIILESSDSSTVQSNILHRSVTVVSTPLQKLFEVNVDDVTPAICIITFPQGCISIPGGHNTCPVYVMVHSSDTGDCPAGQCVLYSTTMASEHSRHILDNCICKILNTYGYSEDDRLYCLHFDQVFKHSDSTGQSLKIRPHLDLAFDDSTLAEVESKWDKITSSDKDPGTFMKFKERENDNSENTEVSDG